MPLSEKSAELDFKLVGFRLRQRRRDLGLSTQQVADQAKVARYTVIRIENGHPCHFNTLEKVRHALKLFTDQMVRPLAESSNCAVQRVSDLQWTVSIQKGTYQRQGSDGDLVHVNDEADRRRLGSLRLQPFFTAIFKSELRAGKCTQGLMEIHQSSWVDQHPGEEFVYCLEGPATIKVEGIAQRLETGDAITFDANLPHQYEPGDPLEPGDPPALILMVVTKERKPKRRTPQVLEFPGSSSKLGS